MDKPLKKLNKTELLWIIHDQEVEIERLKKQNASLQSFIKSKIKREKVRDTFENEKEKDNEIADEAGELYTSEKTDS